MIFQLIFLLNAFNLLHAWHSNFVCRGPTNGYCANSTCSKLNCGGFGAKDYCGCGNSSGCPISPEPVCDPSWAHDCSCQNAHPAYRVALSNIYVNNGDCCYVYKSNKNGQWCDGSSDPQSYWMMENIDCPSVANYTTNMVPNYPMASVVNDPALCMYGLKFNQPCSNQCTYKMCVKFNGLTATDASQCKSSAGWYLVRGANKVNYGQLQRPACPAHNSNLLKFKSGYCSDVVRLHYGTTVKRKFRFPSHVLLDGIVVKGNVHLNCQVLDSSGQVVFSHSDSFGCSFLEEDGFDRNQQYYLLVDQTKPCKNKKGYFRIKCIECERRIYRRSDWWNNDALSSHFKSLKNYHLFTNHASSFKLFTFSSLFLFILTLF